MLKLSDLYQIPEEFPMLELQVEMINLNEGNNEELKESCQTLKEYMQYVNLVRKYTYQEKLQLSEAVERAVTECISNGILEDFLKKNRAEVIAMSIFEFDEEKEWKLIREAEYQYGLEDGIKQGRKLYLFQNICKKLRKGKDIDTIAEEMEEDIDTVRKIYTVAKQYAPEYHEEEILKELIKSNL